MNGVATMVAAAAARISQRLVPINAASATVASIQRDRAGGAARWSAATARPKVSTGKP